MVQDTGFQHPRTMLGLGGGEPNLQPPLVLITNIPLENVSTVKFVIGEHWPPKAVLWLHQLGGKLGLPSDRDGPYCLLLGIAAVITTAVTLSLAFLHPFPFEEWTYG